MNNFGKMNLKKKELKNYLLYNHSQMERNPSPHMIKNSTFYNYINNNNTNNKNLYKKIKEKKNNYLNSYKNFFNHSNNYLSSSRTENNYDYNFKPNVSQNNEKELLIQKMKNLIRQREKNKEKNILDKYNSQNYFKMIKKNIDTYPNGINLSISNCETQYPINNLNEDEFFHELKIFLQNYENQKTHDSRKSYDNVKDDKKIHNIPKIHHKNAIIRELPNNYMEEEYVDNYNYNNNNMDDLMLNNKFNKKNRNLSKEYNNTVDNFRNKSKDSKKNKELNEKQNNTTRNKNYELNEFKTINTRSINNNYYTNSRNKLMTIDNTNKENNNKNKKFSKFSKTKSLNEYEYEKNIIKQYELQERYVNKIKLFIAFLERYYIISLNNFFLYFIRQLQLYSKEKYKKNQDSIKLLKRFQKSRNVNKNYNSFSSHNNLKYNNNHTYNINNHSIENYESKNKLYITNSNLSKNNNNNPNIYIPKNNNNMEQIRSNKKSNNQNNLSNDKNRKNNEIFPYFSNNNNIAYTDKKLNLSTDYNSKNLFTSNKKNLIKSRNDYNTNNNSNYRWTEIKNNHFKNISSFDRLSKNNSINEYNTNFNDNNSIKKTIIYVKPKATIGTLKKLLISKDKESVNSKNNANNKSLLYNKNLINKSGHFFNELKDNKNINYNTNTFSSLLLKNNNDLNNKVKSNTPYKNENNKITHNNYNNNNKFKNSFDRLRNKKEIQESIIKDISTYDKRISVRIKYISSENSIKKFSKMRIRRKLSNLKDNRNIFLNNELKLLKPSVAESIQLIPPLTLLNTHIMNGSNKFGVIIEENGFNDYNDYNDFKQLIIKLFNIIENYKKKNVLFFYKEFFDILKANLITSSQKKIFEDIKNSFKNLDNTDISNVSNDLIQNNDTEINNDNNSNNSKTKNNNNKKLCLRRNLFRDMNIPRLNLEDKSFSKDEINLNLNKSDLYERSECSEDINSIGKLNSSGFYDYPKKRAFRIKITKCKIFREKIEPKKKNDTQKDMIKEDEEMRRKNKMIILLTDKFSHYNNCLRIIKNYFNVWKKKDEQKDYKDCGSTSNKGEYDIPCMDTKINNNKDINYSLNNNLNLEDIENIDNNINMKDNFENEEENEGEEDEDSNIDNLATFNNNQNIEINELIKNKNNILSSLKSLSAINNQKRIEINSIMDSEDSKSIAFDQNELEEKIEYFRYYLLYYYIFKPKKIINSEEGKHE